MSPPSIVVVGSVNMDLVLRCDRFPAPGETLHGRDFHTWPGGKGANQAVAAARLAGRVALAGRIGDDAFGQAAAQTLRAEGIELSQLCTLPRTPTGVAMILVNADGENMIALSAGANAQVDVQAIDAAGDLIRNAKLLVCQLEIPLAAVTRAIAIARAASVPVLLNAAPALPLPQALLAGVDLLVVNESEAATLDPAGAGAPDAASRLQALGAARVAVTLGGRGVQWADERGASALPACITTVIDTTGAGDTFVGALAVAWSEGCSFQDAISFAQRAAALSVARQGAMASMPTRLELDRTRE